MATRKAAEALGKDKEIGTLEAGKLADIVVLDLNRPNTCPSEDIAAAIVHGASPQNVRQVFADGRQVVRDGELTEIDLKELLPQARESLRELRQRAEQLA
jgi:5-methylthioadenosine/S-adenosylhomocysteine deaminase